MPKHDKKKKVNITYTSREFNSVRSDLLQHARKYYPTSYLDFSEASFLHGLSN